MNTATQAKTLTDGTLVLRIDQQDTKAHPVKTHKDENGRPGVELAGGALVILTDWDRIAPAAEVTIEDTILGAVARKWTEAPYSYQRKMWTLTVRGTWVGTYDTKRDALAAARIASAVLAYHGK